MTDFVFSTPFTTTFPTQSSFRSELSENPFVSAFPSSTIPEFDHSSFCISSSRRLSIESTGTTGSSCWISDVEEVEASSPSCTTKQCSSSNSSNSSNSSSSSSSSNTRSRSRFTRSQVYQLEHQYNEGSRPSTAVRRALAEATGLSLRRVGCWFQNRRRKAKSQKGQVEFSIMIPTLDIPEQQVGETSSQKTTETTSTEPQTSNRDPPSDASAFTYASPVEASYASLARSLACAAAAAAQAQFAGGFNEYTHEVPSRIVPSLRGQDNFASFQSPAGELEIPWKPVSAFSDWGSNRSSIAIYTPTPADQQEDPFEYDHTIIPDVSSYDAATGSPIPSYTPLYEEFAQFQAAIDRASQARAFPMTLVPASSLIRRRGLSPFFAEMPPPLHRHNSVPPEFVNASSSFTSAPKQIESTIEIQSTIATRRNHTGPTALGGFNFEPKFTTESAQIPRGSQSVDTATNKRKLSFEPSSTDNVMPSSRKSSVHELTAKEEGSPPPESNEASPAPASTQVPELDFSTTAVTPESASFCSNDIASLSAGKDFHALGLPQQQLYIPFEYTERDNEILSSFYSIPSENSSGSSGLGLKDTDSFPFEEFLNTDFPVCGDVTTKGGEAELTQRLEQHLAF